MKRLLLWLIGVAIVGSAGAALYLVSAFPRLKAASTETVQVTPERIARGRYLAEHVILCTECHSDRNWTVQGAPAKPPIGAGRSTCLTPRTGMAGLMTGDSAFPGTLCFANITPDRDTGIGAWTDGEILRAIREGVDRQGGALFPIMPYFIFRNLSDEDARSVVAWLRSLPPVRHAQPAQHIDFPVSFFIRFVPAPLRGPVPEPERGNSVAYGRYLTTIGRCVFCHTPQQGQSRGAVPGMLFAGGTEFRGPFGVRRSANLTPDATGLGSVSREAFIAKFTRHAGPPVTVAPADNTLMAWTSYAGMSTDDIGAIYDYLRTVLPVKNQVR